MPSIVHFEGATRWPSVRRARAWTGSTTSRLRLTLLAPDIVEAILDGRQPEGVTLPELMEGVEVEWAAHLRTAWSSAGPLRGGYQALAVGLAY